MTFFAVAGFDVHDTGTAVQGSDGSMVSGTGVLDRTTFMHGLGSLKLSPAAIWAPRTASAFGSAQAAVMFYIYLDGSFAISTEGYIWSNDDVQVRLVMTPSRELSMQILLVGSWTDIGDPSAPLNLSQWYRVEVHFYHGGVAGANGYEWFLDGQLVTRLLNSNSDVTTPGSSRLQHPGTAGFVYFDDFIACAIDLVQTAYPTSGHPVWYSSCRSHRVVTMHPTSDAQRGSWVAGAGGTTNLWNAVNNAPPLGTASETDLTQIENNDTSPDNSTDEYRPDCGSLVGIGFDTAVDRATIVQLWICHGEDVNAGTKTGSFAMFAGPPSAPSGYSTFTFGNDIGALGTYPTNWIWAGRTDTNESASDWSATAFQAALRKTDTGNRVGSICAAHFLVGIITRARSSAPVPPSRRMLHLIGR